MTLFSRHPGYHRHRFLPIILRAGRIYPYIAILGLQIGIHEQFHIIQRSEHRIFHGIILQHRDPLFPAGAVGLCPAVSPHAVGTVTGGALDIAEQNDCCQKCPRHCKITQEVFLCQQVCLFTLFPLSEPALRSSHTSTVHWPPSTAHKNTTG